MENRIQNQLNFKEKIHYGITRSKGIPVETDLSAYNKIYDKIKEYSFKNQSDDHLRQVANMMKKRILCGEKSDHIMPELFALISEVMTRTLGITPYGVQIIGGIALSQGKLIQMQTGEGKTVAIVFPACLAGLTDRGVHVMTANDYLAGRDAEWMNPVYAFLGLRVGFIREKMGIEERQHAYNADITYLTAKECGFDFLRDQLQYKRENLVQRNYHMVIVDEADFILIDEARIPLVIAGPAPSPDIEPVKINEIIPCLKYEKHFRIDKSFRRIYFTLAGESKIKELLGCGGVHEEKYFLMYAAVNVALHAHYLLVKDVDYIVRDNRIELVDENTGRVADGRRWPYGIQTALEAKEGLNINPEGRIYGSITIQHLIRLYPNAAALTATAEPAAREFAAFYNLRTVIIPPHKADIRIDAPDMIFTSKHAKMKAIIDEIKRVHQSGRPILVGTRSVSESQELYQNLLLMNVNCRVLNAKNDDKEAELIAQGGMIGAVTISTNMAGRGTDIKLGGPLGRDKERILALGGLYVLGTNRHESVRIDNQLRGRAGRQGDPGFSRFFISLEDDLVKRYGITEFIPGEFLNSDSALPVINKTVAKEIIRAQEIIEDQHYEMRRTLRRYSELCEKQRAYIAFLRKEALKENRIPASIRRSINDHFIQLSGHISEENVNHALCRIFLTVLDHFWADHLLFIDSLKEGIYLQHLGGREPLLVFIQQVSDMFEKGLEDIALQTIKQFCLTRVTDNQIEYPPEGMKKPSGTWTYHINDNPFPCFKIGLLASSHIGAAAIAAIPVMILELCKSLFSFLKKFRIKILG